MRESDIRLLREPGAVEAVSITTAYTCASSPSMMIKQPQRFLLPEDIENEPSVW